MLAARSYKVVFRIFVFLLVVPFLFSCGGGGSAGGESGGGGNNGGSPDSSGEGGSNNTPSVTLGANQGQALLGPIVDATVTVFNAEAANSPAVCTVMTSSTNATNGPGIIDLSSCSIIPEIIYLLVVSGGMDIDVDDNGVLDPVPTPKNGTLKALMTGADIARGSFRVNIVTELAYQGAADALLRGESRQGIVDRLESVARQLLAEDLNGDRIIDNNDLLSFIPAENIDAIAAEKQEILDDILVAILSGDRGKLRNLSRQYLLGSLGEYTYLELMNAGHYQNFLVVDYQVENGLLYAVGYETESSPNDLRILIIDVQDLLNVHLVGEATFNNLPANPQSSDLQMIKAGNYLYLIAGGTGLIVADVTNPAVPIASVKIADPYFYSIAAGDSNTLYIGSLNNDAHPWITALSVYDISNPGLPSLRSTVHDHLAFSMDYENGYLYTYGSGVSVLDARAPGSLTVLDNLSIPSGSGRNIVYENGFAYVPVSGPDLQGIKIIDVRNPTDIREAGGVQGAGYVTNVTVHGDRLFAGISHDEYSTTMTTFEIESSGNLRLLDSRSAPNPGYTPIIDGERIYLSGPLTFIAYNFESLQNDFNPLGFIATSRLASDVEVVGNIAYVADGTSLLSIDVSTPADGMEIIDEVVVIDRILDMRVVGNYAYLANSTEGLKIVDISNPADLRITGANDDHIPTPCPGGGCSNLVSTVSVQGDYAYTFTEVPPASLGKFLISDPVAPTLVIEKTEILAGYRDSAINGNYLYAVDRWSLAVFNADTLSLVSQQNLLANTIEVSGNYAYISSIDSGLSILNLSNPASPQLFGGELGLGIGNAVFIKGDIAYVANEFGLVEFYNISNKIDPELLGTYKINGPVRDIFVTDDYVYAVNGFGLVVEPAVKSLAGLFAQ